MANRVVFGQIRQILDRLVEGRDWARIRQVHGAPQFGWGTLDQLKQTVVRPDGPDGRSYSLIDPALVKAGRGADTNLVRALRDANGVDFNGRMPFRPPPGRYATPDEIQLIIDWLNAGMPE